MVNFGCIMTKPQSELQITSNDLHSTPRSKLVKPSPLVNNATHSHLSDLTPFNPTARHRPYPQPLQIYTVSFIADRPHIHRTHHVSTNGKQSIFAICFDTICFDILFPTPSPETHANRCFL